MQAEEVSVQFQVAVSNKYNYTTNVQSHTIKHK